MHSFATGGLRYTAGVSAGLSPAENVWLSLGYNFLGFEDRDFRDAGYTAEGVFVSFRLKFDQESLGELLGRLTPP
jgi:hypothetical protein